MLQSLKICVSSSTQESFVIKLKALQLLKIFEYVVEVEVQWDKF